MAKVQSDSTAMSESVAKIRFSKELHSREAVFAATERFMDRCFVSVMPFGEFEVEVTLSSSKESSGALEELAGQLANEVHDQQVRLDLERRNGHLRDIILRHAFAPIRNLQEVVQPK